MWFYGPVLLSCLNGHPELKPLDHSRYRYCCLSSIWGSLVRPHFPAISVQIQSTTLSFLGTIWICHPLVKQRLRSLRTQRVRCRWLECRCWYQEVRGLSLKGWGRDSLCSSCRLLLPQCCDIRIDLIWDHSCAQSWGWPLWDFGWRLHRFWSLASPALPSNLRLGPAQVAFSTIVLPLVVLLDSAGPWFRNTPFYMINNYNNSTLMEFTQSMQLSSANPAMNSHKSQQKNKECSLYGILTELRHSEDGSKTIKLSTFIEYL